MNYIWTLAGSKYRRRAQLILSNSINQIALILFSPLLSFLVIRLASVELWGEFVQVLIVVQLGAHIAGWGNREYLLRAFSRTPAAIAWEWRSSLLTRFPLLLLLWIVLALLFPSMWPPLVAWSLALFFAQSCDVLVVYRKRFSTAAIVEIISLMAVLGAVVWGRDSLSLEFMVALFAMVHILKALAYGLLVRQDITSSQASTSPLSARLRRLFYPRYFTLALPFFLLTFSGMLQSRIDLYAVNIFLAPTDVAQYQVFINFLLYMQAAAGFIMQPFVKSVYRLDYPAIRKISVRLAILGCLILPPGLLTLALLLTRLYDIHLPAGMYLWGALYVLPIYFYLPTIYALYKAEQQNTVIRVNFFGVALNFTLSLLLLPRIGVEGAVISAALVSWLAFFIYLRAMRRLLQSGA